MDKIKMERMKNDKGFIAALDQSGGSTPKALAAYGIAETEYSNEKEMFDLVHAMRTRIMTGKAFNSDNILARFCLNKRWKVRSKGFRLPIFYGRKRRFFLF